MLRNQLLAFSWILVPLREQSGLCVWLCVPQMVVCVYKDTPLWSIEYT